MSMKWPTGVSTQPDAALYSLVGSTDCMCLVILSVCTGMVMPLIADGARGSKKETAAESETGNAGEGWEEGGGREGG